MDSSRLDAIQTRWEANNYGSDSDAEDVLDLVREVKRLRGYLDGWQSRALLAESDRDRAMQVVADAAFVLDLEEGDTVPDRLRWLIRERDHLRDGIGGLVDDYTPPSRWPSGGQMLVPTSRLKDLIDDRWCYACRAWHPDPCDPDDTDH